MSHAANIHVDGNSLEIDSSGLRIGFPWPVAEVLRFDSSDVVRVEPDTGSCFNENVFGIALDGRLLWQIAVRQHVYGDSPYTCVTKLNDKVKLFNWDGDELIVEPSTGAILNVKYSK